VTPRVVILSAPSGGGKTTIARALAARRTDVGVSVSATTRAPRPGERDGEAYHFVTAEEFRRRVAAGQFLEWAEYAGALYGTLRAEVDGLRAAGRHALLDIELQGARQVRARLRPDEVIAIFVLPPSAGAWRTRLRERRTESAAALARRFAVAANELAAAGEYEHHVVNEDLDRTVAEVSAIVDTDGRPARRPSDWRQRIDALRREALRGSQERNP
jgi:guanylate kinase